MSERPTTQTPPLEDSELYRVGYVHNVTSVVSLDPVYYFTQEDAKKAALSYLEGLGKVAPWTPFNRAAIYRETKIAVVKLPE
jgi:hypothetical protein